MTRGLTIVGQHESQPKQSEGAPLQHTASALDEMARITVNIKPATASGLSLIRFCMQDAEKLVKILSKACGPGTLWDSNTVYVPPNTARQLVPGNYTFRVDPPRQGPSNANTLATGLLSILENFTATMEEVCQDNNSPPGCRTFSDISSRKAGNAADILGLYILDGPAVVELSKPGTPRCDDFPLTNLVDIDGASRKLASYHEDTLKKMGLVMGRGGLEVLDLRDKKDLLSVSYDDGHGDQCFSGGIDCAVVPFDVPEAEAANHIWVAFAHFQLEEDKDSADSQGSEGGSEGGSQMTSLSRHNSAIFMTMLAVAAVKKDPLVATDGTAFTLCRLREDVLLLYEHLPAQEVYYAIAQSLLLQQKQAEKPQPLNKPSAETAAQCTLKRKLEDCSVGLEAVQDHRDCITFSGGPVAKRVACASDTVPLNAAS